MKIYIVTIRDFCIVHLHNVGTLLPQIVKAFSHISREIYTFLFNFGKGCSFSMACISVKYDLLLLILVSELKEGNAVKYQISLAQQSTLRFYHRFNFKIKVDLPLNIVKVFKSRTFIQHFLGLRYDNSILGSIFYSPKNGQNGRDQKFRNAMFLFEIFHCLQMNRVIARLKSSKTSQ